VKRGLHALQGLSVKSVRGDAVLFYALHPNGTTDLNSEHGSCPTLKVDSPVQ
jgi:prolyl 4-hydroxylase